MRKRIGVFLGVIGVGAGVALAADPETAWREALRTVVTTNGLAVQTDTNATTLATQYAPAFRGQWLLGSLGSSNGVWVASGVTTNDWIQLKP